MVVTNGDPEDFVSKAIVCQIPETPDGYEWLLPLMDYIPLSLLAGYVAELQTETSSRFQKTTDLNGNFCEQSLMTIDSSKIEIFD